MSALTNELGRLAREALLAELGVTPKPGLVDREHRGAHRDLCFERLEASAFALEATFVRIARASSGERPSRALREEIGELGRAGERAMLVATGGSNAHRGALYALGLLVAATASAPREASAERIAATAAMLARLPDRFAGVRYSHGLAARRRHGATGARGEAARGFPHAARMALPLLRTGLPASDVLLALMSTCVDTCVLHRGGLDGSWLVRRGARHVLALGGSADARGRAATRAFDAELCARNVSPGGSADLLAAALYLQGATRA